MLGRPWTAGSSTAAFGLCFRRREKLWFARKQVHPVHSVLSGCLLLGCRAEAVKPRGNPDFLQANLRQRYATSSASGRAPAIQPVQRSMLRRTSSPNSVSMTMSPS